MNLTTSLFSPGKSHVLPVSCPPQPTISVPNLLNSFVIQPADFQSQSNNMSAVCPQHAPSRGLKNLFSRSRVASPETREPEPSKLRRPRVENSRAGPSTSRPVNFRGPSPPQKESLQTLSGDISAGRKPLQAGKREEARSRPASPDRARRNLRLAPSSVPAIQKGEDGRWQRPSLSRGSMSTSALALYQQDDSDVRPIMPAKEDMKAKKGHKHSFSLLFSSDRFAVRGPTGGSSSRPPQEDRGQSAASLPVPKREETKADDIAGDLIVGSSLTWEEEISPPPSPTTAIGRSTSSAQVLQPLPSQGSRDVRHEDKERVLSVSVSQAQLRPQGHPVPRRPRASPCGRVREISDPISVNGVEDLSKPPCASQLPEASSFFTSPPGSSSPPASLSLEHYLLRLSTSILVRSLTPLIRGSGSMQHDKKTEVFSLADERLSAVSRMEKAWDTEWLRAAEGQLVVPRALGAGSLDTIVRLVEVDDRAQEKERRAWVEALRDGILFCL